MTMRRRGARTRLPAWPAAALALCTQACTFLQPDYVRPETALPEKFEHAVEPAVPQNLAEPPSGWWHLLGSAELDGLIVRALENNHDIRAAVHRIAQAKAQAGIAAGPLLPKLGIGASAQGDSPTGGITAKTRSPDGKSERSYQATLSASYEIDLWGLNRSNEDAAIATLQASSYDREALALTLVAEVASTYLQYLLACDRVAVAEKNVASMQQVLDVVQKRHRVGEGARLEVMQQKTALAQARASVPALELVREQSRDLLATLVGEIPEGFTVKTGSLSALTLPSLPTALPSSLLERRPDIRRAEASLVAANAQIGAARAGLLPSFDLTAQRGVGSYYLNNLFNPASYLYVLAGNMAATLFDNGRNLSAIDFNQALFAERAELYRQTVLDALRDVEDSLAAIRSSERTESAQIEAFENASAALQMSREAFSMGTSDYLTVLDTERTLYQSDDAKAQARFDRLNAAVSLFRSLAGTTYGAANEG